jgi:hypothetical protein
MSWDAKTMTADSARAAVGQTELRLARLDGVEPEPVGRVQFLETSLPRGAKREARDAMEAELLEAGETEAEQ